MGEATAGRVISASGMLHLSSSGFYCMREEIRQSRQLSAALPHRASGLLPSVLWVHVMESLDVPAACQTIRFAVPTICLILSITRDANTAKGMLSCIRK
jgi:hypothetical protein